MKISQWQEKNLIKKIQSGDENTFAKVYDLYVDSIYRFVFLKISDQEKAQEIVQDAFMKFWNYSQDKSKTVRSIKPLLYQISRFLVIDHYRSRGEEIISIEDEVVNEADLATKDNTESELDTEYDLAKVKQALEKLPNHYKDIIIMKYIDDLSNKEIAEVVGKEIGNIRVLAHRAVIALKNILKED